MEMANALGRGARPSCVRVSDLPFVWDVRGSICVRTTFWPRPTARAIRTPSSWESLSPSAVAQRSNSSGAIRSSAIVVFPASSVPAPTR